MPALVVVDGPLAGRRFELDAAETVVGREGDGIALEDAELSRRHAVVRIVEERVEIEDLGSLNGTFVNGERLMASRALADGDTLRLGATTLAVEAARPAGPTVLSPPAPLVAAPSTPFGESAPQRALRPQIASRRLTPQLFTTGCIVGTAIALVAYFGLR